MYKRQGWASIDCDDWWELNRWVKQHGPLVWCRYFDHNTGEWTTHQVLVDNAQCAPEIINEDGTAPYYVGASIDITDIGGN